MIGCIANRGRGLAFFFGRRLEPECGDQAARDEGGDAEARALGPGNIFAFDGEHLPQV